LGTSGLKGGGGRSSELTHSAAPWHESSPLCFAEDEEG
jgi:hypothetical protein